MAKAKAIAILHAVAIIIYNCFHFRKIMGRFPCVINPDGCVSANVTSNLTTINSTAPTAFLGRSRQALLAYQIVPGCCHCSSVVPSNLWQDFSLFRLQILPQGIILERALSFICGPTGGKNPSSAILAPHDPPINSTTSSWGSSVRLLPATSVASHLMQLHTTFVTSFPLVENLFWSYF